MQKYRKKKKITFSEYTDATAYFKAFFFFFFSCVKLFDQNHFILLIFLQKTFFAKSNNSFV